MIVKVLDLGQRTAPVRGGLLCMSGGFPPVRKAVPDERKCGMLLNDGSAFTPGWPSVTDDFGALSVPLA